MDLVKKEAALILEEKDFKGDELLRLVEKLLNDKLLSNKIKNNLKSFVVEVSAGIIYKEIKKLVGDKNE